MANKLNLTIISQEQKLAELQIDSLTAPTADGEITILPGHIALFSRLILGELRYQHRDTEDSFIVSRGFLDVNNDSITVMVDTAVAARNISVKKAEEAVKLAQETMSNTSDRQELIMAEASLRQAMLEIKVSQKTKKAQI